MMLTKSQRAAQLTLAITFFFAVGIGRIGAQEPTISKKVVEAGDMSREWLVQRHDAAVSRALKLVGMTDVAGLTVSARLVRLDDDNTPFLYEQIIGRPIWHVVIDKYKLKWEGTPRREVQDKYERTFDVFLDPEGGQLVKIVSRWPKDVERIPPEPSGVSSTEKLSANGNERYHAFPDHDAPINFLQALQSLDASLLASEQIVGQYVVWSRMEQDPRPVWVITIRRREPLWDSSFAGVGVDARNHFRYIVDPQTGMWICRSSSPQPDIEEIGNFEKADEP